jgi:hypothetical protein
MKSGKGKKQKLSPTTTPLPMPIDVMSSQLSIPIDVKVKDNEVKLQQRLIPTKALAKRWSSTSSFLSQQSSALASAVQERIPRPKISTLTFPKWKFSTPKENPIRQNERVNPFRLNAVKWPSPSYALSTLREWKSKARHYISKHEDEQDDSYMLGYYILSFAIGLTFDMLF